MADEAEKEVKNSWWSSLVKVKSMLLALSLAGLLATNIATLVSASAHDFFHSVVWHILAIRGEAFADGAMRQSSHSKNLELSVKNQKLAEQLDVNAKTAKTTASKIYGRLKKGVLRNTAALPAESVPYLGIGVTLAVTTLDLYDACSTMSDINSLLKMMGQGEEEDDLCGRKLPTKAEIISTINTDWKKSADEISDEADKEKVPMPKIQLPTMIEIKQILCPLGLFICAKN